MGKRPSPARALLVGLVASLAAGLADAALGTSKPPDVVYRTPSPAPTTAVDTTIRDTAQQAVGTLQGVLDVLQTVRCVNGVCTFPNGTVTTPPLPTRPPSPTTAVILPGVRPTQPTARPTGERKRRPAEGGWGSGVVPRMTAPVWCMTLLLSPRPFLPLD